MSHRIGTLLLALVSICLFCSCSGPEAKKEKFYRSGKLLLEKGEYAKSVLQLKNAVQIDPRFAEAHFLLGMAELKSGNHSRAYGCFAKTVELNPKHLDAQAQLAKLFFMSGDRQRAREKVTLVLRANPNHEEATLVSGALLLSEGEPDKAVRLVEEALARGASREDFYLLLAAAHGRHGDAALAEQSLQRGLQKNPSSIPLHRALADVYVSQSRIDAAAGVLNKMMAIEPANHTYAITLASLLHDKGKEPAAVDVLQKMLGRFKGKEEPILDVASFYAARQKRTEAEQTLRRGLASIPDGFRVRFALAELLASGGDVAQATGMMEEWLKTKGKGPDSVKAKTFLARCYLAKGQVAEAARNAGEALKASPHNADAQLVNGQILLQKGQTSQAVAAFRTYVNDQPKTLLGYLMLAKALLGNQENNLALQTLQSAQKQWPDDPDLRQTFIAYFQAQKDTNGAERFLAEQLKRKPGDMGIQAELGNLFMASGDLARAGAIFAGIKEKYPRQAFGFLKAGEAYLLQGNGSKAISEFERACAVAPSDDRVLNVLVQACVAQKQYGPAISRCEQRIRANRRDNTARILLAQVYMAQGKYRNAEKAFAEARVQGADPGAVAMMLANMYTIEKDYVRARSTYEDLVLREPANWKAKNDFACFLADYGTTQDLDRALALAREAGKVRPDDALILDTVGWIHFRKGNYKQAEELVKQAVAKLPRIGVLRYHLGMILYRSGKNGEAKVELQKAAASTPFPGRDEAVNLTKKL